jgi:hypothetical protein
MTGFRFTYERLDRLAKFKAITPGHVEPRLLCDRCRKVIRLSDCYELTPVDFESWRAESASLETLLAFGLNRCRACIPADATPAAEALDDRWKPGLRQSPPAEPQPELRENQAVKAEINPTQRQPQRRRINPANMLLTIVP